MAKNKSSPLTEDEIQSVYRNEFYSTDTSRYYNHRCTGGTAHEETKPPNWKRSKKAKQ